MLESHTSPLTFSSAGVEAHSVLPNTGWQAPDGGLIFPHLSQHLLSHILITATLVV